MTCKKIFNQHNHTMFTSTTRRSFNKILLVSKTLSVSSRFHSTTSKKLNSLSPITESSIFDTPYANLLQPPINEHENGEFMGSANKSFDWKLDLAAEADKLAKIYENTSENDFNSTTYSPQLVQRERDIFKNVFDSIVETKPEKEVVVNSATETSAREMIDEMLKDVKLKVFDKLNTRVTELDRNMVIDLRKSMEPVIDHINSINTDVLLIDFIHGVISSYVPISFSGKIDLSKMVKSQVKSCERQYCNSTNDIIVNPLTLSILLDASLCALYTNYNSSQTVVDVFTIYNQIKQSSNYDLYFYGCSTEVFNFLIDIGWREYYDLKLVHSLLTDMKLKGCRANEQTLTVLESVKNHALKLQSSNSVRLYGIENFAAENVYDSISDVWNEEDALEVRFIEDKIDEIAEILTL